MKLQRNLSEDHCGKFAIVPLNKLAQLKGQQKNSARVALQKLVKAKAVDFGDAEGGEFFVIKLQDVFAPFALKAYAEAVLKMAEQKKGAEPHVASSLVVYANDILDLFQKAVKHPRRKIPD
jgi:hypothetical protein